MWTLVIIVVIGHFYLMKYEHDYAEFVIGIKGLVREYTVGSKTQEEMIELAKPICDRNATRDTTLWNDCLRKQRYAIVTKILNLEADKYIGTRSKRNYYLSDCVQKKEIVKYEDGTTRSGVDFVNCSRIIPRL